MPFQSLNIDSNVPQGSRPTENSSTTLQLRTTALLHLYFQVCSSLSLTLLPLFLCFSLSLCPFLPLSFSSVPYSSPPMLTIASIKMNWNWLRMDQSTDTLAQSREERGVIMDSCRLRFPPRPLPSPRHSIYPSVHLVQCYLNGLIKGRQRARLSLQHHQTGGF